MTERQAKKVLKSTNFIPSLPYTKIHLKLWERGNVGMRECGKINMKIRLSNQYRRQIRVYIILWNTLKGWMPMFSNYDDVVKLSDMMEILAIGRNKAYDLLRSGQINSFKIGKAYRIPKMALKNFVLTQAKMSITSYKELAEDE